MIITWDEPIECEKFEVFEDGCWRIDFKRKILCDVPSNAKNKQEPDNNIDKEGFMLNDDCPAKSINFFPIVGWITSE